MRLTDRQKAEIAGDAHVYGGALILAIGAGTAYPPLGPISFGLFLCWLGLFWRGR